MGNLDETNYKVFSDRIVLVKILNFNAVVRTCWKTTSSLWLFNSSDQTRQSVWLFRASLWRKTNAPTRIARELCPNIKPVDSGIERRACSIRNVFVIFVLCEKIQENNLENLPSRFTYPYEHTSDGMCHAIDTWYSQTRRTYPQLSTRMAR